MTFQEVCTLYATGKKWAVVEEYICYCRQQSIKLQSADIFLHLGYKWQTCQKGIFMDS